MTLRLALTPGEPSGVGPDLVIQTVQQPQESELVVFADQELLTERAAELGLPVKILPFTPCQPPQPRMAWELVVAPVSLA